MHIIIHKKISLKLQKLYQHFLTGILNALCSVKFCSEVFFYYYNVLTIYLFFNTKQYDIVSITYSFNNLHFSLEISKQEFLSKMEKLFLQPFNTLYVYQKNKFLHLYLYKLSSYFHIRTRLKTICIYLIIRHK